MQQNREAMERVSSSEQLFRAGFREAMLGMLLLRREREGLRVLQANPVAEGMMANGHGPLVSTLWTDRLPPVDRDTVLQAVEQIEDGVIAGWRGEVAVQGPTLRWLEVVVSDIAHGDDPAVDELQLTLQLVDVTARREAEAKLAELALHDLLTGLPNRAMLLDRLEGEVAASRRSGTGPALLFCDLDDFKQVNDRGGHHVGDQLLQEVARRLGACVRDMDTVARLGGDEFVLLCPDLDELDEVTHLTERVLTSLAEPFLIDGVEHVVRTSIGVVLTDGSSEPDELLRHADTAMYQAKAAGKGRAVVHVDRLDARSSGS